MADSTVSASEDLAAFLGYFKYEGELVDDGLLDARKAAQALSGMDRALRYYLSELEPQLKEVDFELPVRIRKGSWEALLPETLGQWLGAGAGITVTSYLATAAKKAAENDVGDRGVADLARAALRGVQWFVRLGKHLGQLGRYEGDGLRIDSENGLIGVPNSEGELLWIPKFHFEILQRAPPSLLSEAIDLVEEERQFLVGVVDDGEVSEERVDYSERAIFVDEEDEEELFPELEHGMEVDLEGRVTRGNRETNTIGFKYRGHILTCKPKSGSIVRFKPVMFSRARIVGVITRQEAEGEPWALRPKIIFSDLEALNSTKQESLFR